MYGFIDLTFADFFFTLGNAPRHRGNCLKLDLKHSRIKYQSAQLLQHCGSRVETITKLYCIIAIPHRI